MLTILPKFGVKSFPFHKLDEVKHFKTYTEHWAVVAFFLDFLKYNFNILIWKLNSDLYQRKSGEGRILENKVLEIIC